MSNDYYGYLVRSVNSKRSYHSLIDNYFTFFMFSFLFFASIVPRASAHDATLTISRSEPTVLELSFSLDTIATLQRTLVPRLDPIRFLIHYSNMPSSDFEIEFEKVKLAIENDIRIEGPGGSVVKVGPWRWPSANEMQNSLRETVQALLNDPTKVWQPAPLNLTTSARSKVNIMRIHLSLAQRLRPILVVRPNIEQFWIDDLSPDAMIDF